MNEKQEKILSEAQQFLDKMMPEDAINLIKKHLVEDPGFVYGIWGIAELYARSGRDKEAITWYEKLLSVDDGIFEAHLWLAGLYLKTGDKIRNAVEEYEKALKINPGYTAAWTGIAIACSKMGDFEKTKKAFLKAIDVSLKKPRTNKFALLQYALYLHSNRNYKESQVCYERVLAIEKELDEKNEMAEDEFDIRTVFSTAKQTGPVLYIKLSSYRTISEYVHAGNGLRSNAVNPSTGKIKIKQRFHSGQLLEEAEELMKNHKYEEAAEKYREALKEDPGCTSAAYSLADILLKIKNNEEARDVLELCLKHKPYDWKLNVLLADAFAAGENYEAALRQAETAVDLNPYISGPYLCMAKIYLAMKNIDKAENIFNEAVKAAPSAEVYLEYGHLLQDQIWLPDARKKAEGIFIKAVELEPDNFLCHGALCYSAFEDNRLDTAAEEARIAMKLAPDSYGANYYSGLVHVRMGSSIEVCEPFLLACIEIDPSNYLAYFLMGVLNYRLGGIFKKRAEEWWAKPAELISPEDRLEMEERIRIAKADPNDIF